MDRRTFLTITGKSVMGMAAALVGGNVLMAADSGKRIVLAENERHGILRVLGDCKGKEFHTDCYAVFTQEPADYPDFARVKTRDYVRIVATEEVSYYGAQVKLLLRPEEDDPIFKRIGSDWREPDKTKRKFLLPRDELAISYEIVASRFDVPELFM